MLNKPTTPPLSVSLFLSLSSCPVDLLKIYKNAAQSLCTRVLSGNILQSRPRCVYFVFLNALRFLFVLCVASRCRIASQRNATQRGACGTNGSCCLAHINNKNSGARIWQMGAYIVCVCVWVGKQHV